VADNKRECSTCGCKYEEYTYFCRKCGAFLLKEKIATPVAYQEAELKVKRIMENMKKIPHRRIQWNNDLDAYAERVECYRALAAIPEIELKLGKSVKQKMTDFIEACNNPEFQIAFVGTIKTGKSTLINALLGNEYASMAVTPETAALTKFRSSEEDYVNVTFYTSQEWAKLWASRSKSADAFMEEYRRLDADSQKDKWIDHAPINKKVLNSEIKKELTIWSSSKSAEHYFVKEIEVGISSLPKNFPRQVVFVDTPGLSDPVAYRSEITKDYIRKASAVMVCVDAQKISKEETDVLSSVFSYSSHNKRKVHLIATHWDTLNNPKEDWRNQKSYLINQLSGRGFFGDRRLAETNIMHSAAYLFNLCKVYDTLSVDKQAEVVKAGLSIFGNDFLTIMVQGKVREEIPRLIQSSNISNIMKKITDELVANYKEILQRDMKQKYKDIVNGLKRAAKESKEEWREIIRLGNADLEELKKKTASMQLDSQELQKSKQQLVAALAMVEKQTRERKNEIVSELEKVMNRAEDSKKNGTKSNKK